MPSAQENNNGYIDPSSNAITAGGFPFKTILLSILLVILLIGVIVVAGMYYVKIKRQDAVNPNPVPTISPGTVAYTIPTVVVSVPAAATLSAERFQGKDAPAVASESAIGRLSFIRDGDIYNTDLATTSALVRNSTPAGEFLRWSPEGNLLAWIPKSTEGTPSALTVYDRVKRQFLASSVPNGELYDYAWSPDEKKIVIAHRQDGNQLSIVTAEASSSTPLVRSETPIRQVYWFSDGLILYRSGEGLMTIRQNSSPASVLFSDPGVSYFSVSPDQSKILYRVTTGTEYKWFIIQPSGSEKTELAPVPKNVTMDAVNLPATQLSKGFDGKAVWFPSSDKLLIGYKYLSGFSIVGVYDMKAQSFAAVAPFYLSNDDIMVDSLRLLGTRVNTSGGTPSWQIVLYTMEEGHLLSTAAVIPNASSPAFYGKQ